MFYEPDSGLYLTQFRAYDPVAGRWLSRDPAGEVGDPSNNLYAYVGGNPLGIIDPLGLCGGPFDDLLAALASSPLLLPEIIGTEIVGGGPENPLADAAVVAEIEAAEAATAEADVADYLAGSGGRFGGAATRNLNNDIATSLEDSGYDVTNGAGRGPEEYIPGPGGGVKGGTYVDITASNGSETIRVQTVDTLADGATPTARESAAAGRIRARFPNDRLELVPK